MSFCKPVEEEHLKFNYGDFKRAEEKKRRVTLGAMPYSSSSSHSNGHHSSALDVSTPLVERPDTNTFVSSATLGRKVSTLSWNNGHHHHNNHHSQTLNGGSSTPVSTRFRSLGRNGSSMMTEPMRRRSEHSAPLNVRINSQRLKTF